MEKSLACVAYKSVIDPTKINFNDFVYVYTPLLDAMPDDGKTTQDHIKEAKEIYTLLDGGTNLPKAAPQNVLATNSKLTFQDLIFESAPVPAKGGNF